MKSLRLPLTLALATSVLPLAAMAQDYTGAVSEQTILNMDAPLWGKVINKTLTLEPGKHTFSVDSLGMADRVVLTLLNPGDTPVQFETAKVLGAERIVTVPANSSRTVTFVFKKPISDEVEYFVMNDPGWARTAMATPVQTSTVVTPPASTVTLTPAPAATPVQPAPQVQTRQAVRGFW